MASACLRNATAPVLGEDTKSSVATTSSDFAKDLPALRGLFLNEFKIHEGFLWQQQCSTSTSLGVVSLAHAGLNPKSNHG